FSDHATAAYRGCARVRAAARIRAFTGEAHRAWRLGWAPAAAQAQPPRLVPHRAGADLHAPGARAAHAGGRVRVVPAAEHVHPAAAVRGTVVRAPELQGPVRLGKPDQRRLLP